MNVQEKIQATASGLRAGRTVAEIVKFNNLSKSTVKRVKCHYDPFIAGGGLPEDFETTRKVHKRRTTPWTTPRSSSTRILAG
jgi:hypothetical protein